MHKFVNHGKFDEEEFEVELDEEKEDEESEAYNFTSVLNKNAAQNRRIYLWGEVDENSAISVVSQLHYFSETSKNPIQLIIHSAGGEVDAALSIIDEMLAVQNSGITLHTLVTGKAYSAAALILIMGTIGCRYSRPHASIMLHPIAYGLSADYSDYQDKLAAFIKGQTKILNDIVGEKIGLKTDKQVKKFITDMDKGLWMNAGEALERKIIDKILDTALPENKKGRPKNVKSNNKRRIRTSLPE